MEDQTQLSLKYEKEPGILSVYLDYLYCDRRQKMFTAYNSYMTLRTLAKYLKKQRAGLPCDMEEVELTLVTPEDMLSITKAEWGMYLDYYQYSNRQRNGSLAVRISVIRMFYRWLTERMETPLIRFVECEPRPRAHRPSFTFVTEKMEAGLYDALDGNMMMRNACIINMLLHCGVGLQELLQLDLEDMELDRMRVRGEYGTRYVPINEETSQKINNYLSVRVPPKDGTNPLFVSICAARPHRRSVEKMLSKTVKRAGFHSISVRDLQQTCIQRLIEQGDINSALAMSKATSRWYVRRTYCDMQKPTTE